MKFIFSTHIIPLWQNTPRETDILVHFNVFIFIKMKSIFSTHINPLWQNIPRGLIAFFHTANFILLRHGKLNFFTIHTVIGCKTLPGTITVSFKTNFHAQYISELDQISFRPIGNIRHVIFRTSG